MEKYLLDVCRYSSDWCEFRSALLQLLCKELSHSTPTDAMDDKIPPNKILKTFSNFIRGIVLEPEVELDVVLFVLIHASLCVDQSPEWLGTANSVRVFNLQETADPLLVHYMRLRKAGFDHSDTESPSSPSANAALEDIMYRIEWRLYWEDDAAVIESFKHRITYLIEKSEGLNQMEFRFLSSFPGFFDPMKTAMARDRYCESVLAPAKLDDPCILVQKSGFTRLEICGQPTRYTETLVDWALSASRSDRRTLAQHPLVKALLINSAQRIREKSCSGAFLSSVEARVVRDFPDWFSKETTYSIASWRYDSFRGLVEDSLLPNGADLVVPGLLKSLN